MTALPKTEIELFLHYLRAMDTDKIELLLDDSVNCFGVSKSIFIERLKLAFEILGKNIKPFETSIEHSSETDEYKWVFPNNFDDPTILYFYQKNGK
ncbi:MAG TPA: hypothetical protein VJY41_09725 [Prolixibacteraceae bacterium]|nr:hypothetical protein [Prolixibacteraceae bacterium]